MKELNQMTLVFDARSVNESFARVTAAAFLSQLDPTLQEIAEIKTIVSEAVTNCIVHAYPDELGVITVRCRILKGQTLDIVVKDKGIGISDIDQARKPMFTTGGTERSGMRLTIMESIMTNLDITSEPGKGTTVHMRRKLQRRK